MTSPRASVTEQTPVSEDSQSSPTVIGTVGAPYFPIALIARFPYAMMVVGVLTLVVSARGSLSLGGLTSAMVGLGTALCGPLIGAAADRFGQRTVLLAAASVSSLALLAMAWIAYSPLPPAAVLISAFFIGATGPQVPPMSRSRLVGIIMNRLPAARQQKSLNSTMAYESAADELTFVFGPLIVGILAATMGPAAPILGAAVLTLIFVTAFALHRSAYDARHTASGQETPDPVSSLFDRSLLILVLGVLGVGFLFGSTLTSLTSFMDDMGQPERAGLVYGAMGVGSAIFALGVVLFPERFSLRARWATFGALILVGAIALHLVEGMAGVVVVLLIMGIGIGPTLVTLFSLMAQRSPRGRSATAMSIASTSVVVGQSAASAVTGSLAENYGTTTATLAPLVAAVTIMVAACGNWAIAGTRRAAQER